MPEEETADIYKTVILANKCTLLFTCRWVFPVTASVSQALRNIVLQWEHPLLGPEYGRCLQPPHHSRNDTASNKIHHHRDTPELQTDEFPFQSGGRRFSVPCMDVFVPSETVFEEFPVNRCLVLVSAAPLHPRNPECFWHWTSSCSCNMCVIWLRSVCFVVLWYQSRCLRWFTAGALKLAGRWSSGYVEADDSS